MKIEVLLHNLSHSDLVLDAQALDKDTAPMIARPRFSEVNQISQKLYRCVKPEQLRLPVDYRVPENRSGESTLMRRYPQVATGFVIGSLNIKADPSKLRFRESLPSQTNGTVASDLCALQAVYFPLLAVLIPKWLENIGNNDGSRKVIVLVSGRGKPIDSKAKEADNSTEFTAKLASLFIRRCYPELEVHLLHSNTNLFRYDENIVFVKRELLPCINRYRDELVTAYRGKWKEYLNVTLSFADGTSARVNAINASLRHFRPSYMHFWVVKSFWRSHKVFEDDVECHLFEEVATEPAIPSHDADDPWIRQVVDEMDAFRKEVKNILTDQSIEHDLDNFWLRKTKKPVLAVLLVEKNGITKLFRGSNMEVSMPTGSLCAERNAIGTALSSDLTLMRDHIKVIAVYSVTMPSSKREDSMIGNLDDSDLSPRKFCLPCDSQDPMDPRSPVSGHKRKIMRMTSELEPVTATDDAASSATETVPPPLSRRATTEEFGSSQSLSAKGNRSPKARNIPFAAYGSHADLSDAALTGVERMPPSLPRRATSEEFGSSLSLSTKMTRSSRARNIPFASPSSHADLSVLDTDDVAATIVSKIVPTMTTVMVDESDMNPLKPCGACNEWLKKIAEVNPNLRVITFTDADCKGIYVEHIAD